MTSKAAPWRAPRYRTSLAACLAVLAFAACSLCAQGAERAASADEQYLDALAGKWDMRGSLGGQLVQYHAFAERVLMGGFVSLHMIDAAASPQYEADLYLGFDAKAGDYVGHWLDRYGASGARIVATGRRNDDVLMLIFPYADASFRDTFTRHPATGTWSLLIESQAQDRSWSTFATYELKREK